jgi:hypothetical protein
MDMRSVVVDGRLTWDRWQSQAACHLTQAGVTVTPACVR